MIFVVSILALLVVCRGDVSHLDTDLRDDGYHYQQPYRPFSPGKNELDEKVTPTVLHQKSDSRPQTTNTSPVKPTAEYLPPFGQQDVSKPFTKPTFSTQPTLRERNYGTPSTSLGQTLTELTRGNGRPNSFIPQTPSPAYQENQKPQQSSSTFAPVPVSPVPKLSLTPEREYLPPGENEITKEKRPKDVFPGVQKISSPKVPIKQPTIPAVRPTKPQSVGTSEEGVVYQTPSTTYSGSGLSNNGLQSTYPETEFTYPAQQPTYTVPQTSPTNAPQLIQPESEESKPDHELGPDGYKYKVPSSKFNY